MAQNPRGGYLRQNDTINNLEKEKQQRLNQNQMNPLDQFERQNQPQRQGLQNLQNQGQNQPYYNQRPGNQNLLKEANNFEEAIQMVYQSIKEQMQNKINSLSQFFTRFDDYKDRVFAGWELLIIFPGISPKTFEIIHLQNQKRSAVKTSEIQLAYLVDQIELLDTQLVRHPTQTFESAYLSFPVSDNCSRLLQKIAENREVQYDSAKAFDDLFAKQTNIDFPRLDRALKEMSVTAQPPDIGDLVAYFAMNKVSTSFQKVQFVQGMKPWVEKKRPKLQQQFDQFGQVINPAAQGILQQALFNPNMMMPPQMPVQPIFQGQAVLPPNPFDQQGFLHPDFFNSNGIAIINKRTGVQYQIVNGLIQTNMGWLNAMNGQPVNQQAQNMGGQLNAQAVNLVQNQIMGGMFSPQQVNNQIPLQNMVNNQFIQQNMMNAQQLNPQQYMNQQQMNNLMPLQNMVNNQQLQQMVNQFPNQIQFPQDQKYQQIINKFSVDLGLIHDALILRHTGVYKWFSIHCSNGLNLSQMEFVQAINQLNLSTVNSAQNIYLDLQAFSGFNQNVQATEIEALFKAYGRREKPKIIIAVVMDQILKAFNYDEYFIQNGLSSIQQPLNVESFTQFFGTFPDHYKYFNLNDITQLGECFSISLDQVDLNLFCQQLQQQRRLNNNQKQLGFEGIQNAKLNDFGANYNPLMPNFSSDNTKAASLPDQRFPHSFQPYQDERKINEIIIGSFIANRTVFEHFSTFGVNGKLTLNDFISAVKSLAVSISGTESEQMFKQIDSSMNGSAFGQVQASDIDRFIHFSCKKKLNRLHEELLEQVQEKQVRLNRNLLADFNTTGMAGVQECQYQEFKQIILQLGVSFVENQMNFLSKKYQVGRNIQYKKFVEDIEQITRQTNQIRLIQSSSDMPTIIAESIKKLVYIKGYDLTSYITSLSGARPLSQHEFLELFGHRLDLVPKICANSNLIEIYNTLNNAQMEQVSVIDIIGYIETKCPKSNMQLLQDTCHKLQGMNLNAVFQSNPDFVKSQRLLMSDFIGVLTGDLKIVRLDAEFLAKCFDKGGDVDVNSFIQECSYQHGGSKEVCVPIIKKIATAVHSRQLQLNNLLTKHKEFNKMSIPCGGFIKEIKDIIILSVAEQDILQKSYQSHEGFDRIDYINFCEDVHAQTSVMMMEQNQVALTKDQAEVLQGLKSVFKKYNLDQKIVQNLKKHDRLNSGYMTRQELTKALDETIAQIPQQSSVNKMSSKQIDILCSCISQDTQGRYNWSMIIKLIFQSEAEKLLNPDQSNLNRPGLQNLSNQNLQNLQSGIYGEQKTVQKQPNFIQAESAFLDKVGRKIMPVYHNIVERINTEKESINNGIPMINEMKFSNILKNQNLSLSVDERNDLSMWCQKNQDINKLVNSHKLFVALGLEPPQVAQKSAPKRVLTAEELKVCQDVIILMRQDILGRGRERPEQVVQRYRQGNAVTLSPKSFRDALVKEFQQNVVLFNKISSNTILSNLVHYLVREEPGRVSFAKLIEALNLPINEQPLRQDAIADLIEYQAKLSNTLSSTKVPLSIIELNGFMKKNNLSLSTILELHTSALNGDMAVADFEKGLQNYGYYKTKEIAELVLCLQTPQTGKQRVSIAILQKHLKSLVPSDKNDPASAQRKYGKMNPTIKSKIQNISDYLVRNNITIDQLHKTLDANNDGSVDKQEFVDGMSRIITTANMQKQDLASIFDAIDLNGDQFLSVNEFGYYLQGAKLKKEQKKAQIDQATIDDVQREIQTLFMYLDKNNYGYVTAPNIQISMSGLGQNISIEKANEMIRSVDKDGDGKISQFEFFELMKPILLDELVASDSQVEDMRAKFKEADTDYSGFLSVDEFYACLLSMGADVSRQEVINMFTEFDADQNGQIDIDEFVKFFSIGDQVEFQDEENIQTYMKIKKARKLNVLDFLKAFNSMPQTFTPSFFAERWNKQKKNLPSSAFRAQIDPKTMLWKDMMPVLTENLTAEQNKIGNKPKLRPVPTILGTQITFESAEGVPLPAQSAEFDRTNIVKRVIRVGLFDTMKQELIHNSAQVVAEWNQSNEDIWVFDNKKPESMGPILFRTTASDDLNREQVQFVFELVVYVKIQNKLTEMCAGWCQTQLNTAEKDQKIKLEILGGSPANQLKIQKEDLQTKRSGFNAIAKIFSNNIKSSLTVSFKPLISFEPETKLHLELLTSTCFIQKKLLLLVSGYRNYAANELLHYSTGSLKQPEGNVMMSCFCKILDSPDLIEAVTAIWSQDYLDPMTLQQKKSIDIVMSKTEDIVQRLYPVLFSDGFAYSTSNPTETVVGDQVKLALRKQLVNAALRFNNPLSLKNKASQAPEQITTFKPFNVRETEYEIWA